MSSLNGADKSEPRGSDDASVVAPVESTAQRVYPTVSEETADEWALRNAAASFP